MNWLDWYVEAVRRYLPARVRDDVAEEIRSTLQERVDDAADEDGITSEDAQLRVLTEFGHPLRVAAAYQDRRVLISEPLFPIYRQAVKYIGIAMLTLFIVSSVLEMTGMVPGGLGVDLVWVGLLYFALLTLGFHLLDRHLQQADLLGRWNPRQLPPAHPDVPGIPLGDSIASVAFLLVWFWLLTGVSSDTSWAALTGRADTLGASIVLWLRIHALLALAMSVVNVFRPWWTPAKLAIEAGISLVFLVVMARLLLQWDLATEVLTAGYTGTSEWVRTGLPASVNITIRGVLIAMIAISGHEIVTCFRRIRRLRGSR
jgi:hypothetical protein